MPPSSREQSARVLGVDINTLRIDEAIDRIIQRCDQEGAVFVTKPYVEFFKHDNSKLLGRAWLILPDGVATQWAAYYKTTSGSIWQLMKTLAQIIFAPSKVRKVVPDKFAGINFTWPLLQACAASSKSVYLVGSPVDSSIESTAATLDKEIPGIQIVGTMEGRDETGVFSKQLESKLTDELKRLRPDVVLIGIGFPRQELLMDRLVSVLDHGVFIGEGGTFDYELFGGKRPKAPRLMQKIGLEWLWRLILEPRRIRRQTAIPVFIWKVYKEKKSRKPSRS